MALLLSRRLHHHQQRRVRHLPQRHLCFRIGMSEQAHRYQEIEIQSLAQTDLNGQQYQQDRHQAYTASQEPIPVVRNPVTFAFSLPFNSGRVVILHKTVTVAGIGVTLERMVATPSETRFDVQGKQVTLDDSFSLSDDGKNVDDIDASVGGITD